MKRVMSACTMTVVFIFLGCAGVKYHQNCPDDNIFYSSNRPEIRIKFILILNSTKKQIKGIRVQYRSGRKICQCSDE